MNRINRVKRDFRNNEEIIAIFIVSIIATCLASSQIDFILSVFLEKGLNNLFFGFLGYLLGLFLITYAIFFSIVPQLSEELRKAKNFRKINTKFFIAHLFVLLMLIISFGLVFFKCKVLLIALMFLFIFDILLFLLILVYLFLLFREIYAKSYPGVL